jgi:hypothetical protein
VSLPRFFIWGDLEVGAAYCPTIYVGDGVKGIYGAWMMYVFGGDRAIVRAGRAYGL